MYESIKAQTVRWMKLTAIKNLNLKGVYLADEDYRY